MASDAPDSPAGDLLPARLARWAAERGNRQALLFLENGATEAGSLTFAELHRAALAVAGALVRSNATGRPVLILSRSGLDFAVAFFGCVYAGAIAVPCGSGPRKRGLERILAIAADASPAAAIGDAQVLDLLEAVGALGIALVRTDQHDTALATAAAVLADRPALLQYTSGSTASPKGVVITHGNLAANLKMLTAFVGIHERSVYLTWLPLFHDMGLIGSLLHAVYCGIPCILMPPLAFFLWPERWLAAIGRYRATITGGPSFAYEYCVRRHAQMDLASIDLSGWEVAFCGGERVRAPTMQRFAELFAATGFRASAMSPCYGLAEATLLVSGVARGGFRTAPSHDGVEAVSCGRAAPGVALAITDPQSARPLADGQIGEIWVGGDHVAAGYWNKPDVTAETFLPRPGDAGETRFLRTGDLGWMQDGELYVAGRLKDLIICRGSNFHPEDIEATAAQCHPALGGSNAAFPVEAGNEEQVVLVQEVPRPVPDDFDPARAIAMLSRAVAKEHALHLHDVVLVRAGAVPRTTSGKVQRRRCGELYSHGRFEADAYAAMRPFNRDPAPAGSSPKSRPPERP